MGMKIHLIIIMGLSMETKIYINFIIHLSPYGDENQPHLHNPFINGDENKAQLHNPSINGDENQAQLHNPSNNGDENQPHLHNPSINGDENPPHLDTHANNVVQIFTNYCQVFLLVVCKILFYGCFGNTCAILDPHSKQTHGQMDQDPNRYLSTFVFQMF
jgi:hypothetical protein